jgi:hypothetical protein
MTTVELHQALRQCGPYEQALYLQYQLLGETAYSDPLPNKEMAARAGMSVNRMKQARARLAELGLIHVAPITDEHGFSHQPVPARATHALPYQDVTPQVSPDDTPLSQPDTPLSGRDTPLSGRDTPYQDVTPPANVVSNARVRGRVPARVNLILKNQKTKTKDYAPGGAQSSETAERSTSRKTAWEPQFVALVKCFGLTPETLTPTAAGLYWKTAHELHKVGLTAEDVPGLYRYVCELAERGRWSKWTAAVLSKHAPDYLRDRKATGQDGGFDLMRSLLGPNGVLLGDPRYDPSMRLS